MKFSLLLDSMARGTAPGVKLSVYRLAVAAAIMLSMFAAREDHAVQAGQTPPPAGIPGLQCVPLAQALNPPPSIPTSQDVRYIRRVDATESSLVYSAAVPGEIVDTGRPVDITLTIKNTGRAPVALSFPTAQRFDVVIWNDDCTEVWRWSRGRAFAQVIQSLGVPAGGTIAFHIRWDQRDQAKRPVRIGSYEARVAFLGQWGKRNTPLVLTPLVFALR